MPDREKVIKGLESCILRNPDDHARCSQCSYGGNCVNRLKMDALALLKEQEAVVRCKDCRYGQYCTDGETTYQCFKWNSAEFGTLHEQNWFCADGERREVG